MYAILRKIRNISLPVDLKLKLFDTMILPIVTYGSEVWGFENVKIIEKLHVQFCKKIMRLRNSTPNYMVYGELGRYPIEIEINVKMVCFWNKLISSQDKLSYCLYQLMFNMHKNNSYTFPWLESIRDVFNKTGLGYIWNSQDVVPNDWLKSIVKQSLCDQFVQSWSSSLQNSSKGQFYRMFKRDFICEDYFLKLNTSSVFWICKLRTSNMNFPVETGRWSGLNRNERKCPLCTSGVGDEMHYLFQCDFFSTYRIKYIPMYYIKYPNIEKLQGLLTYCNKRVLENISVFLKIIYKTLNNHR